MPSSPRLILLGIDGATWDVALPYIEAGRLPALERLTRDGAWGTLLSIDPPVTAACWPTIFTGTNPGQHGMFEFFKMRPGTYETRPTTLLDWRRSPLWELLNRCGLTVGVFNVPVTFPPQPLDGYMVSGEMGLPSVDHRMFCPDEVGEIIRPQLRRYELDPVAGRTGRDVRRLARQVHARNEAALALAEQTPTDVLIVAVNYVDHAQHVFWDERFDGLDAAGPKPNPVLLAYEGADRLLQSLQNLASDDCTVIALSDHGAGPVRGYLDMARMLSSLGYLEFTRAASGEGRAMYAGRVPQPLRPMAATLMERLPAGLKSLARKLDGAASVDYPASGVFPCGSCGSLRVNVVRREPAGHVPGEELEAFCLELKEALSPIEGIDREVLFQVHLGSELYDGPHTGLGPDLIGVPQDYAVEIVSATPSACHWLVSRAEGEALGLRPYARRGNHRLEGIVAAIGPGVTHGLTSDPAPLADVTPTVMSLLGCPLPSHLEGGVMPWADVAAQRANRAAGVPTAREQGPPGASSANAVAQA